MKDTQKRHSGQSVLRRIWFWKQHLPAQRSATVKASKHAELSHAVFARYVAHRWAALHCASDVGRKVKELPKQERPISVSSVRPNSEFVRQDRKRYFPSAPNDSTFTDWRANYSELSDEDIKYSRLTDDSTFRHSRNLGGFGVGGLSRYSVLADSCVF
ncbi:hypothetical protein J6590_041842 [Homalodisca vitripennis]|nr:hypothetical protein J6590_041842 [Homalodisca vitripennis]